MHHPRHFYDLPDCIYIPTAGSQALCLPARMSRFTGFDGLPLIVHDRILRSLPSPQDVANTIRASPGSLHAFVTGRRSILLSALKNFLSPENQHLMNLVMAAPHFYYHRQVTPEMSASSPQNSHD